MFTFSSNAVGDLICNIIYKGLDDKPDQNYFLLTVPKKWKDKINALVQKLNAASSFEGTCISINMPEEPEGTDLKDEVKQSVLTSINSLDTPPRQFWHDAVACVDVRAPDRVEDILKKGISLEGLTNEGLQRKVNATLNVVGKYNSGKTTLIEALTGVQREGATGKTVHTAGSHDYFVPTSASSDPSYALVRDTEGEGQGSIQSGSSDDLEARRRQRIIPLVVEGRV